MGTTDDPGTDRGGGRRPSRGRPPTGAAVLSAAAVLRGGAAGTVLLGAWTLILLAAGPGPGERGRGAWLALGAAVAYVVAGALAARGAPDAPLSNAIVAAMGALVGWLPLRALLWWIRGEARGLVTGRDAALAPTALASQLLLAAALGLAAGLWVTRRRPTGGNSGAAPRR
jgi:hypothetical protein